MSQSRATLTIKITFPENCSNEISSPALFLARSSVNDIVLPRALSVGLMCTEHCTAAGLPTLPPLLQRNLQPDTTPHGPVAPAAACRVARSEPPGLAAYQA